MRSNQITAEGNRRNRLQLADDQAIRVIRLLLLRVVRQLPRQQVYELAEI